MSTNSTHTPARGKTTPASSGGSFRSEPNTDPDDVMPDPATPDAAAAQEKREKLARLEQHNEQAVRLANAAHNAHMKVNTEMLRTALELEFPDATGAVFFRSDSYDYEPFYLMAVRKGDEVLYNVNERSGGSSAYNIAATYLGQYEDDTTSYLTEGDETPEMLEGLDTSGAATATLQLNADAKQGEFVYSLPNAIGFDDMNRSEVGSLRNAVQEELSSAGGFVDVFELEYRLADDPEYYGLDPAAMGRFDEKYGSRQAALQALTDTSAWQDLDDKLGDAMTPLVTKAVHKAVAELDAVPAS